MCNLLLNNVLDVTPINCALGSENGYTTMVVQEPTVENSPAGCRVGEGENRVAIRTLDSLGIGPVSFIKIDVEKHEFEVLKGAVETLKRDKPVLYIEIHTKELVSQILPFLSNLGYVGTPEIITHISYPDAYTITPEDMLEVYGFLFKIEKVPHA